MTNALSLPVDPLDGGIAAYARRIRSRRSGIEAATRAYLDRIDRLDGALHAYCHVDRAQALATARFLDEQLARGIDYGILMGVPVGIKDNIRVDGMPFSAGSKTDAAHFVLQEDSFVAALRKAGCVIIGKLHTVEFALGNTGINTHYGTPRNPWDADAFRLPSGSSSGSAVAVAAGLCGFAVGTDTGGSVRGPAAHCGVFGMKFTAGRWEKRGVLPVSPTLDALGVLTRSAKDAAVVWSTLHHQDEVTPRLAEQIRVGTIERYFFQDVEPGVDAAVRTALARLQQQGVVIESVNVPGLDEVDALYEVISKSELYRYLGPEWVQANRTRMNPDVYDRLQGASAFASRYDDALRKRNAWVKAAAEVFDAIDVIASPTKRRIAPRADVQSLTLDGIRSLSLECAGPTRSANFYDFCGITHPLITADAGLPAGLQLLGKADGERALLEVALTIEDIVGAPARPDVTPFHR